MSIFGTTIMTIISSFSFLGFFGTVTSFFELLKRVIKFPLDLIDAIKSTVVEAQFFLGRLIATNFGVFLAVIAVLMLAIYSIYYIVIKKAGVRNDRN